jgi:MoaA/NifB/PqqE/SkfB family radical SAM enzyme
MVAHASRRVPHVHLVTNGLLLDDVLARELARAGLSEISISLDGEREWHNRLRHSDQGYDAALRAIETVKRSAPDMRIVVNTVIFPDRLDQVRKAVAITVNLGVLHKVQPVNRHFLFHGSVAEPEPIRFEAADIPAVERLTAELSKNRRIVNSRFYLKQIPSYFSRNLICPMIRPRCLLPHFFLEASSYGRVSPCMIATGWEGVLDIRETLRTDLAGRAYRERKKALEACRKCDEAMYICYWEPMIQFPLSRFIRYGLY